MQATPDYRLKFLYSIAFTSSLGSLHWGYTLAVFNSLRSFLLINVFPDASNKDITLLASLIGMGAAIGAYTCSKLLNQYGRRKTLIICDIAAVIGSLLTMVQNLPIMIIGRGITGLVIGMNSAAVPLYSVEISPLKMKGVMGTISMVVMTFGMMVGLAVGFFIPEGEEAKTSQVWRVLLGVPILFGVVRTAILVLFLKFETPYYLVLQGKIEEARDVLGLIYTGNTEQYLQKVIKDKEASTNSSGNLTAKDLLKPKYSRAFWMGIFVGIVRQATGFTTIFMFFNVLVAESASHNQSTLALFSTLLGFNSFLASVLIVFIVEKFGRRPLMIFGSFFSLVVTTLFVFVGLIGGAESAVLKYILILWPIFYRLGDGTLGFLYISEILPSTGLSLATFANWVASFVLVQAFWSSVELVGVNGMLIFHSFVALASTMIYHKYLIESKGKTKAELLQLYSHGMKGTDDAIEMKRVPLI